MAATLRLEQTYVNPTEEVLEDVTYTFPLPESAAVHEFEALVDGRRVVGVVKEKHAARAVYEQAVASGKTAALLEEDRPDIFQARVGNLAPGQEVVVRLAYCQELPLDDGHVRLTIPSHVGARYDPSDGADLVFAAAPATTDFAARLTVQCGGVAAVVSPSHPQLAVEHTDSGATLALDATGLEKDLVIRIRPRDLFQPRVAVETSREHAGATAAMLTFVPKFSLPRLADVEVVFLVDCSGSMRGQRMAQTRAAMQVFLRSLPVGCHFNIVRFGSSAEALFPASVPYSDATLLEASALVEGMEANLGGTEILAPLRAVLDAPPVGQAARQVLVLTDGQVRNEHEILAKVQASASSRVFALGVGHGVSTFLVKGLGRAGRGASAFVLDGERLEPACVGLLTKAMTPAVMNLRVSWPAAETGSPGATGLSFFDPSQPRATPQCAPREAPAIFADEHYTAFCLWPAGAPAGACVLTGDSPLGPLRLEVPLEAPAEGSTVPLLAARCLLRDLEGDGEATALALQFGLSSATTAFVAVDEQGEVMSTAPRQVVRQQLQLCSLGAGPERFRCAAAGVKSRGAPRLSPGDVDAGITPMSWGAQDVSKCMEKCIDAMSMASLSVDSLEERSASMSSQAAFFSKKRSLKKKPSGMGSFIESSGRGVSSFLGGLGSLFGGSSKEAPKARGVQKCAAAAPELATRSLPTRRSLGVAGRAAPTVAEQPVGGGGDPLASLLQWARADGSFDPAGVARELGLSARPEWPASEGAQRVYATVCALQALRERFAADKPTWVLVHDKAARWLESTAGVGLDRTLEEVLAALPRLDIAA